jgi:hypothetical protein
LKFQHIIICTTLLSSAGVAWVRGADEPQVWLMQRVSQRLDYGLEAVVEAEQRLSPGAERVWQRLELDPQVVWHYSPRYDFGTGYENSQSWHEDGTSDEGHEAFVFTTLKWEGGDWRVSSRLRFQSGFSEDEDWFGVLRHRLAVEYMGARLPLHIRPFLDDEWFFDLVERGVTENRLRGGLMYQVNKVLRIELFGMRQDEWMHGDVHHVTPIGGMAVNLGF